MIRALLMIGAAIVWLLSFGVAMVTIIPVSAMSLPALFDSDFTMVERLEAVGFIVLGLIVVAALLFTLTHMSRIFSRVRRAQN